MISTKIPGLAALLVAVLLTNVPALVRAQPVGEMAKTTQAQPPPQASKEADLQGAAMAELFQRLDINHDARLNVDELPASFRPIFARVDLDHDGYATLGELRHAIEADTARRSARGPVVADRVVTVADDFVVEVYLNGERVPDARRKLLAEVFGASVEETRVEIHRGDSVVFHVVNNRLRWDGASYFAAVGTRDGTQGAQGLATNLRPGSWSRCDDPAQVAAFLSDPTFLAGQAVRGIDRPWSEGDSMLAKYAGGLKATPIWGDARSTWLRVIAY